MKTYKEEWEDLAEQQKLFIPLLIFNIVAGAALAMIPNLPNIALIALGSALDISGESFWNYLFSVGMV